MNRKYHPEIHDPILREMNIKWRRTDQEIADEMGFDKSTIRQHRTRLGLPNNTRPRPVQHPTETHSLSIRPEKPNPVAMAVRTLGARITERNGSYILDGRLPISAKKMVKEANRIREMNGMNPIGPPEWR